MKEDKNKIDWSQGQWKETLHYQRRFMWAEDMLDIYARWMGLRRAMTAVDVGCGLGYLGMTYWPYFGKGGSYIGIDSSVNLLAEARQSAPEWAQGGITHFISGDVFKLPLPDDFTDWVMCQTLLMHLKDPGSALAEMARILKPGGLIMCKEPDNLASMMAPAYVSAYQPTIEEQLLMTKVSLISYQGRIKLGRGNQSIGRRVPHLLRELGFENIGIRLNDKVSLLEPPYEGPLQQHQIEITKKNFSDEETFKFYLKLAREEFAAGGGDPADFELYCSLAERIRKTANEQLKEGSFYSCNAGFFFIIKGRKPL